MPHPAIAIRLNRLAPLRHQVACFVAQRIVAGRLAQAGHATQPLSEDGRTVFFAPSAERRARRGKSGGGAKAPQNIVVGQAEVVLARMPNLLLPGALE